MVHSSPSSNSEAAAVQPTEKSAPGWRGMLRRVHSLTGAVPLAALMTWYLGRLAKVSASHGQLVHAYTSIQRLTQRSWLAWPLLCLLVFHAGYGLLLLRSRSAEGRYPVPGKWRRLFQRSSAVVVALWLMPQVWWLALPLGRGEILPVDAAELTRAALSSTTSGVPWQAFGYLLGLAAMMFHAVNGMWSVAVRRGWLRAGKLRGGVIMGVAATLLFLVCAHSTVYLATGWRAYTAPATNSDGSAQQ